MLTKNDIIKILKENKIDIKNKYFVKNFWLFGSYARNEQKKDSDIDLIVEFDEKIKNTTSNTLKLGVFLEKQFKKEVDLGERKYIKEDYISSIFDNNIIKI